MILTFKLTMPSSPSWNGLWSGSEKLHCVTRRGRPAHARVVGQTFHYSFGDGWVAAVEVGTADARSAAALRRKSSGFCGYDWMVDSIMRRGKIVSESQLRGTK